MEKQLGIAIRAIKCDAGYRTTMSGHYVQMELLAMLIPVTALQSCSALEHVTHAAQRTKHIIGGFPITQAFMDRVYVLQDPVGT